MARYAVLLRIDLSLADLKGLPENLHGGYGSDDFEGGSFGSCTTGTRIGG
jgi:hypothetical protein